MLHAIDHSLYHSHAHLVQSMCNTGNTLTNSAGSRGHWTLVTYKSLLGALDSQDRDIPRYTEITSKFPVLVKAGHSALEHQTVLPAPNRVRSVTRLGAGSTVWCSVYRGISRPANRARLLLHLPRL